MLISLFLIVIDIVLSIAGQLLLKSAMTQVNQINGVASLGELAERLG
ncbi:MAG: hypothetical protein HY329_12405, partial [Chloroflexi bacterium]|nr:hypothetical protein [Chloroflexota bacterium]